jgi:uncharacterized protein YutE (UPF0331/DUF86 family)
VSPGHPDRETVHRHLAALDTALRQLRRHARRTPDELRADLDLLWAVERGLQLCLQNTLDVATHLVASAGHDAPDYASSIDELGALGILPLAFAKRLRAIAGFRNVLVHGYLEVDVTRLQRVLAEQLDDFVAFAEHVERYLGRTGAGAG